MKKTQEFDLCSASCVFFHFYIAQPQLYLSLPLWGDDRVTVVWFAEVAIIPTRVTALCKFFISFLPVGLLVISGVASVATHCVPLPHC